MRPKSNTIMRRVGTKPFVSGGAETFLIPRTNDIYSVIVEIVGSVTLTTAATTVSPFSVANLIRKLILSADGNKTFDNKTGIMACFGNFEQGLSRDVTAPGVGIATHPVQAFFRLDRAHYGGMRPKDSALHTSLPYMTLLELNLTYGNLSDMWSVFGAGVISASPLTVNVYLEENQEYNAADLLEGRWIKRTAAAEIQSVAANSRLQFQAPQGTYLRGFKILGLDNTVAYPSPAAVINSAVFKVGQNVRRSDLSFAMLRHVNRLQYETGTFGDGAANVQMAFLDLLPKEASLGDLFDLRGATDAFLELDVTANARVQIETVTFDLQPPKTA